ncbi:MAG: T9SS type A sorting domain-containing protein [Bacteroidota bacterium]
MRDSLIRWVSAAFLVFCLGLASLSAQVCDAEGGFLSFADDGTTVKVICPSDGIPDPLTVNVSGANGQNQIFLVTDNYGNILANSTSPNFDFEGSEEGACFIFNLAYDNDFTGDFGVGGNYCMFNPGDGCFDLSSYVLVIKDCDFQICEEEGGDLTIDGTNGETSITICAGDGESDAFDVDLQNNVSTNSAFLITDLDGNILSYPASPPFDLEGAGPGICLVWHISFDDDVTGLVEGGNADDISGCFDLSNFIQVTRYEAEAGEISLEGGATDTVICVDEFEDPLEIIRSGVTAGELFTFVITDEAGNILALPDNDGPFDLNGAGPGTCLIWYLAYNPDIQGLEVNANAFDLEGCLDLSNAITVVRNEPDGGEIQFEGGGTDTVICAGNGIPDPLSVEQIGTPVGGNFTFVITDAEANILDIPSGNGPFDLEGAGGGTCLIWFLAFEDGLMGAEVGQNAGDLVGCFDLSNPLTVVRNFVDAGTIAFADSTGTAIGDTVTICAGDGIPDPLDVIQTGDPAGSNFTFVITDADANILDIPSGNGPFDLEGAGGGTCLIWYLAFEDGLQGAEVGQNAADLEGCFDLSNPLTVIRNTGDECNDCPTDGAPGISVDIEPGTDPCETLRELTVNVSDPIETDSFMLVLTDSSGIIINVANNTLGPVDFSVGRELEFDGPEERDFLFFDINLEFFGYVGAPLNVYLVTYGEEDFPFGLNGLLPRIGDETDFTTIQSLDTGCLKISEPILFDVDNCLPPCEADAGTLQPGLESDLCISGDDGAFIAAQVDIPPVVPAGYAVVYVLTTGDSLLILDTNFDPNFEVDDPGLYTIHTLVLDSLDLGLLSFLPPGATGGFVFAETIEGGGTLCASLLVDGAVFDLVPCDEFCPADAGTLEPSLDSGPCLLDGEATIIAETGTAPTVPAGYAVVYVLTTGDSLLILDSGDEPEFTVTDTGFYTIHTLVIDSLDLGLLSFLPPGATGGFVFAETIEGGGTLCASLLVDGAPFNIIPCEEFCPADAGTLIPAPDNDPCLDVTAAFLAAQVDTPPVVPPGFAVVYVLTTGDSLLILDSGDEPQFTVTDTGFYTIHTLVIDSLDLGLLSFLPPGATGGFVFAETIEGGGTLCASLLVDGATFNVVPCSGGGDIGILINEVNRFGIVELFNESEELISVDQFMLNNGTESIAVANMSIDCGSTSLAPGAYVGVQTDWFISDEGSIALFNGNELTAESIIDYVEWGSAAGPNTQMAIDADQWSSTLEAPAPTIDKSLQYFPEDAVVWQLSNETLCGLNESPSSIGELGGPGSISVFPNPATDRLTVRTSDFLGQRGTLEISDLNGRRILEQDMDQLNGRIELPLPFLPRGTYMLRMTTDDAIRVIKLQIQ